MTQKSTNRFYLFHFDIATKFLVIRALKGKDAVTVATKLWEIFAEYGLPKILQSDNGGEFRNGSLEEFINSFDTKLIYSAPHHPQTNAHHN